MNEKNKVKLKKIAKSYLLGIFCVFIMYLLACVVFLIRTNIDFDDFIEHEEYDELTKRASEEPYSDWEKSPTGSAKYLDGDSVIVSIFLSDSNNTWTKKEKDLVYNNLDIACKYLRSEGKKYGKDVNLIYDYEKYDDLVYKFSLDKTLVLKLDSHDEATYENAYYDVIDFIQEEIPVEDIMKNHDVNSIAFLVYVDDQSNNAEAYPYYDGYNTYYEEVAFLNSYWLNTKRQVAPNIYAHEILHLFGARDLYETNKIYGVTKNLVEYAQTNYSKDIMLGHATDCIEFEDKIEAKITKLTAYFLGWEEYISEIETFPSIEVKKPAVFSVVEDNYGNYSTYIADSKLITASTWFNKVFCIILSIFSVVLFIRINYLLYKQRKAKEGAKTSLFEYHQGTMWRENQLEYQNEIQNNNQNDDFYC